MFVNYQHQEVDSVSHGEIKYSYLNCTLERICIWEI